jgi:hypothetical protein
MLNGFVAKLQNPLEHLAMAANIKQLYLQIVSIWHQNLQASHYCRPDM